MSDGVVTAILCPLRCPGRQRGSVDGRSREVFGGGGVAFEGPRGTSGRSLMASRLPPCAHNPTWRPGEAVLRGAPHAQLDPGEQLRPCGYGDCERYRVMVTA